MPNGDTAIQLERERIRRQQAELAAKRLQKQPETERRGALERAITTKFGEQEERARTDIGRERELAEERFRERQAAAGRSPLAGTFERGLREQETGFQRELGTRLGGIREAEAEEILAIEEAERERGFLGGEAEKARQHQIRTIGITAENTQDLAVLQNDLLSGRMTLQDAISDQNIVDKQKGDAAYYAGLANQPLPAGMQGDALAMMAYSAGRSGKSREDYQMDIQNIIDTRNLMLMKIDPADEDFSIQVQRVMGEFDSKLDKLTGGVAGVTPQPGGPMNTEVRQGAVSNIETSLRNANAPESFQSIAQFLGYPTDPNIMTDKQLIDITNYVQSRYYGARSAGQPLWQGKLAPVQ